MHITVLIIGDCESYLSIRGLGKTVQTIAFLAWLKYGCQSNHDDDNKPHIIIVPASVLSNWEREFNRFCPNMNVVMYHGSMAERREIKERLREYLPKKKGPNMGRTDLDVVLTTFSYFSSEKQDDRSFLRKFDWNYVSANLTQFFCFKRLTMVFDLTCFFVCLL